MDFKGVHVCINHCFHIAVVRCNRHLIQKILPLIEGTLLARRVHCDMPGAGPGGVVLDTWIQAIPKRISLCHAPPLLGPALDISQCISVAYLSVPLIERYIYSLG